MASIEPWLDPLHDASGMRALDSWAIEDRGVPSLELMEAAGVALAEAAEDLAAAGRGGPVRVVLGKGNNAGDGLVAARHLRIAGHRVDLLCIWPVEDMSPDSAANLDRLEGDRPEPVSGADWPAALAGSAVIVDAIFGTGFAGAPTADAALAIEAVNATGAPVAAADIPSGVDASTGEAVAAAVRATVTVSFHAAKLGQYVNPGKGLCGEVRVVQIGIPAGGSSTPAGGLIREDVLGLAPRRDAASNKFSSGQALIVGGSRGLTGAPCLAAAAAIRAGAGYATVAVPADLEMIFELKLTEVMSRGFAGADGRLAAKSAAAITELANGAAAVGLGPGMGRDADTQELARRLANTIEVPLVIDADALNAHAGRLGQIGERHGPVILTPHAGELARLLDSESAEVERHRLTCAQEAADRSGAIVVLKGDDTIVARPGGLPPAICTGSASGLATAGTGDVLTGVCVALLARGMEPFAAAGAAVLAHRRAGQRAAEVAGRAESVIASDVIEALAWGLG